MAIHARRAAGKPGNHVEPTGRPGRSSAGKSKRDAVEQTIGDEGGHDDRGKKGSLAKNAGRVFAKIENKPWQTADELTAKDRKVPCYATGGAGLQAPFQTANWKLLYAPNATKSTSARVGSFEKIAVMAPRADSPGYANTGHLA